MRQTWKMFMRKQHPATAVVSVSQQRTRKADMRPSGSQLRMPCALGCITQNVGLEREVAFVCMLRRHLRPDVERGPRRKGPSSMHVQYRTPNKKQGCKKGRLMLTGTQETRVGVVLHTLSHCGKYIF